MDTIHAGSVRRVAAAFHSRRIRGVRIVRRETRFVSGNRAMASRSEKGNDEIVEPRDRNVQGATSSTRRSAVWALTSEPPLPRRSF
jgi:hypothetical protein